MRNPWTSAAIYLVILATLFSGCLLEPSSGTESGSTVVTDPALPLPELPLTDPTRTICDPFVTNSPQARDRGLIGNLLYLTDDQPRFTKVSDYMDFGTPAPATIYLDRLFVPTRPFDRGFITQAGDTVTNVSGTTLYEYFGLRVSAEIKLAENEKPGLYQLALLADDGAVLKIPDGVGGSKILVNNDGTHATKMACATEAVYLDHNSKIPVTVEYYQGPRYHISLVAMWRPWPDGVTDTNPVNDPMCGRSGNSLFFDSTKNPVESKVAFYELLSRNWKVLENENYYFPEQAANPCVPAEEPLAISNFTVSAITRTSATLTWTTNIPANSQGQFKNTATGVSNLTTVDQTMVQNHTVVITGLSANTLYGVRSLSTSAGGQNAISDEKAFRTPR